MPNFLENCEKTPLHLSGHIQPHGAICILNSKQIITHISENLSDFLPSEFELSLDGILPKPFLSLLVNLEDSPGSRLRAQFENTILSFVRNVNNEIIIEFTKSADEFQTSEDFFQEIDQFEIPKNEKELSKLRENLIQTIAELSGFQRVMFYSFLEKGDGEVITEKRDASVYGSYFGLRFPASDIPRIARKLYLINPWRQIPDRNAKPIPIFSSEEVIPDLSYSDLRSVPEVHITYLKNMQVNSSLSLPIIISGELQGLIACHHSEPKTLSVEVLEKISAYIKSFNLAYKNYLSEKLILDMDSLKFKLETAKQMAEKDLTHLEDWLIKEFSSEGVSILKNNQFISLGITPKEIELKFINDWFSEKNAHIISVENFIEELKVAILLDVKGFIGIKVNSKSLGSFRIFIFRKEYIYEIEWGGNPEKPIENSEYGIAPRHSFEKWVQKKTGSCRPWNPKEKLLALKLAKGL